MLPNVGFSPMEPRFSGNQLNAISRMRLTGCVSCVDEETLLPFGKSHESLSREDYEPSPVRPSRTCYHFFSGKCIFRKFGL